MMTSKSLMRSASALALLLFPSIARAHAVLLRSDPMAGSRIASPRWIMLWFSERPEIALSSATLKDQSGKAFTLGAARAEPGNPLQISFAMPETLPAGTYKLAWRTVASDGHPSHGTFSFIVLPIAPPTGGQSPGGPSIFADTGGRTESLTPPLTAAITEDADEAGSAVNSLVRALSFAGILLVIGVAVFNILVVSRSTRLGTELVGKMESRAAIVGIAASLMVLLGAFARFYLESKMIDEMPGMQKMTITDMTMHTRWGIAMELQVIAAFLALIGFAIGVKRVRGAWLIASVWAIVLAFTPALAGHAAASARFPWLMVATDFIHVLGAASWLGSLFCVMMIGVPIAWTLGKQERWDSVASLVNAFSPVALASATIVVASGVFASWVHLDSVSALWRSDYGRVLLIKVLLVLITLAIGGYNFRTVQPQLISEVGSTRLRRTAMVELTFGALVIVVTGFLTGISPQ